MVRLPVAAQQVVMVGGPTGPSEGARGPFGNTGEVGIDRTGSTGPSGYTGAKGPKGRTGLDATVTGATGVTGPLGWDGFAGPTGSFGPSPIIPPERFRYYENLVGVSDVGPEPLYAGCKFTFTVQHSGLLFFMVTGSSENFWAESVIKAYNYIGLVFGTGTPPNAGDSSPQFVTNTIVLARGPVPFTIVRQRTFDPGEIWADLVMASGTILTSDGIFDGPFYGQVTSGILRNIQCVILEW